MAGMGTHRSFAVLETSLRWDEYLDSTGTSASFHVVTKTRESSDIIHAARVIWFRMKLLFARRHPSTVCSTGISPSLDLVLSSQFLWKFVWSTLNFLWRQIFSSFCTRKDKRDSWTNINKFVTARWMNEFFVWNWYWKELNKDVGKAKEISKELKEYFTKKFWRNWRYIRKELMENLWGNLWRIRMELWRNSKSTWSKVQRN